MFASVEATTLNERTYRLRPQDVFLRDNIQSNDILIVSIGGNDVALCPTPTTIASVLGVLCLPTTCIENGWTCGVAPVRVRNHSTCSRSNSFVLRKLPFLSSATIAAVVVDHPYCLVLALVLRVLDTFVISLAHGRLMLCESSEHSFRLPDAIMTHHPHHQGSKIH